jgi:hypothetical protein
MNIPKIFRDRMASSVVGTPGVDTSGAELGQAIAEPAFGLAEQEQRSKDEASYNALMVQHKTNIMTAAEDIKVKYAATPELAGPAMIEATKTSLEQITSGVTNPRVKLMAQRGDPFAETWGLKDIFQWSSQQEYKNTAQHAVDVIDDSSHRLAVVGMNPALSIDEMKAQMIPEVNRLASEVNAIKASRHPELAKEVEDKGMKAMYKQLIDSALETQPEKAAVLARDLEVGKYFTPDEVKKYQTDADNAVKNFPVKMMEKTVQQDLAVHPEIVAQVLQGKAGYPEIDAAQKKDTFNLHPETYRYLKDIALNVKPEGASEDREKIRAAFFDEASSLGFKLSNDPTKLSSADENKKAVLSNNTKDLYKFQDDILSAQARGIISKEEAQLYQRELYIPLVAKTMEKNDPSFWQKVLGGQSVQGSVAASLGGLFHITDPAKVGHFQTASSIIDEHITRTKQEDNFVNKSAFYDAYFKAAEIKLRPGVINPKTNSPYTPADVAHAVLGEALGDMYSTKFGLRPIIGYNKKTGAPIVELTKEDDALLANAKALGEIQKKGI